MQELKKCNWNYEAEMIPIFEGSLLIFFKPETASMFTTDVGILVGNIFLKNHMHLVLQ